MVAPLNLFYLTSMLYLVGAAIAFLSLGLGNLQLIAPVREITWIRTHIVTIGAVTQVIIGTVPTLAAKRLGVVGQSASATWRQWFLLNSGILLLLLGLGMPPWHIPTAAAGAALVFTAVASLVGNLYAAARRSPQGISPGTRFYLSAPIFLLLGIGLAVGLLLGLPAPGGVAGIREAHIHANLWGFVALTAAGILLDLLPVLTGRPLAHPGWVPAIYWLTTAGAALLVAGPLLEAAPVMMAGMIPFAVGNVLLLCNLPWKRGQDGPMPVRVAHIKAAYIWAFAPIVLAPVLHLSPVFLPFSAIEKAALQGLVFGWALQLAVAVLPVLAGSSRDASRFDLLAMNAGPGALWAGSILSDFVPWGGRVVSIGSALIAATVLTALVEMWKLLTADQ